MKIKIITILLLVVAIFGTGCVQVMTPPQVLSPFVILPEYFFITSLYTDSGNNITTDNLLLDFSYSLNMSGKINNITDWRKNNISIAVLNMPFTNDSSVTKDYSIYGNDGILYNGITWTSDGKVGGAYKFDGIDDYIKISNPSFTHGNDSFIYEFWMKMGKDVNLSTDRMGVFGYSYFQSDNDVNIRFVELAGNDWGRLDFQIIDNESNSIIVPWTLDKSYVDEWIFITAVADRENDLAKLYVNNILKYFRVLSSYNIGYIGYNERYIGRLSGYEFNGTIDEMRVYDYILSAEQMTINYLAGLANHSIEKIASNETTSGDNWSVAVTANNGISENQSISNILTII